MAAPKGHPRWGGRQKGKPNKATIERRLAAEIDAARAGERELGKDVLERAMRMAETIAIAQQPGGHRGNWDRFGDWFDRWVYAAKELAQYQSPKIARIALSLPVPVVPEPKTIPGEVLNNVVDLQDAQELSRIYQRRVQAVRG